MAGARAAQPVTGSVDVVPPTAVEVGGAPSAVPVVELGPDAVLVELVGLVEPWSSWCWSSRRRGGRGRLGHDEGHAGVAVGVGVVEDAVEVVVHLIGGR